VNTSYIDESATPFKIRIDDHVTPHHPITEDYAPFTQGEMEAMRSSLKQQGLLMPIVTWNGMIVDGRHREKLCLELRIMPSYVEINKKCPTEDDMRRYVAGLNEHRRSRTRPLTSEEKRARAETAIVADPMLADTAISEKLGDVSQPTVHRARKRLEAKGVIPRITPSERKSRTGKVGEGARKTKTKSATRKQPVVTKPAETAPTPSMDDPALEKRVDCILVHCALKDLLNAVLKVKAREVAVGIAPAEAHALINEIEEVRDWLQQLVELIELLHWIETSFGGCVAILNGEGSYVVSREESDSLGYSVICNEDDQQFEILARNVVDIDEAKAIAERHHAEQVAFFMGDIASETSR
jgi:DNA-binding Lrp family transcriptional regulator